MNGMLNSFLGAFLISLMTLTTTLIYANEVQIAAGDNHTLGLKNDGTVITKGLDEHGQRDVHWWRNIKQIDGGAYHSVGLKEDGTVVAAGPTDGREQDRGQCDTSAWESITQVSAGYVHTVGLKEDGTVVAVGSNKQGQCNVSSWINIKQISAGNFYTAGLKEDGTVVAIGDNQYGQCDLSSWVDIKQISASSFITFGLKNNGRAISEGTPPETLDYGQGSVSSWNNIKQISAGWFYTIGLKEDGTLVVVGKSFFGEGNVSDWENICQITTGIVHSVGLKEDGSVVATGLTNRELNYGQADLALWNFATPFYADFDQDGYGDRVTTISSMSQPEGYVADNTDCNDFNLNIHPGAIEACNNVDDDCNGVIEDVCKSTPIFPEGILGSSPTYFSWSHDPAATWYDLFIKNDNGYKRVKWYEIEDNYPNFPNVNCSSDQCRLLVDLDLKKGNYQWWVKAWNQETEDWEWSDTAAFRHQFKIKSPNYPS